MRNDGTWLRWAFRHDWNWSLGFNTLPSTLREASVLKRTKRRDENKSPRQQGANVFNAARIKTWQNILFNNERRKRRTYVSVHQLAVVLHFIGAVLVGHVPLLGVLVDVRRKFLPLSEENNTLNRRSKRSALMFLCHSDSDLNVTPPTGGWWTVHGSEATCSTNMDRFWSGCAFRTSWIIIGPDLLFQCLRLISTHPGLYGAELHFWNRSNELNVNVCRSGPVQHQRWSRMLLWFSEGRDKWKTDKASGLGVCSGRRAEFWTLHWTMTMSSILRSILADETRPDRSDWRQIWIRFRTTDEKDRTKIKNNQINIQTVIKKIDMRGKNY